MRVLDGIFTDNSDEKIVVALSKKDVEIILGRQASFSDMEDFDNIAYKFLRDARLIMNSLATVSQATDKLNKNIKLLLGEK